MDGKALGFFRLLFSQLPQEFQFLSDGLNKGLYRRFSLNHAMKGGHHYSISFDPSQSDPSMIRGKHFELKNILVIQDGKEFILNINVYEGLFIGFEIEKNILDFTSFQFDLSRLNKVKSKYAPDSKIEKLVSGLASDKLELDNLAEFEIDGNYYYQVKDLEDGNYIAIDETGQVFGLFHDPYKIVLINSSIHTFVDEVNAEDFDFEKYLTGINR